MSRLARLGGEAFVRMSVVVSCGLIITLGMVLAFHSWPAISRSGWQLLTLEWNPARSRFGVLPMLAGSLMVTTISLLLATPLGLLTAVFTSEILRPPYRAAVKALLEILAGIPSIVYGLIAVSSLSLWIRDLFDLESGRTILTAGIILSVMILPTIATLSDDALRRIPRQYREVACGLGLYRFEVLCQAILPVARRGLASAVLLALGRALGETMAVMLVVGGLDHVPGSLLAPGQTLTSKLGRELGEAAFASHHFSALVFCGFLLFSIALGINAIAHRQAGATGRLYD